MSELVSQRGIQDPSFSLCGLVHPAQAFRRLTTMSLDLLTSAMQYDGALPDSLRAGIGKQWRLTADGMDIFVDQSAPLGQQIETEDLSRRPSLVGVSVPRQKGSRLDTTHFNVTPTKKDNGEIYLLWEKDDTSSHSTTPPLCEDHSTRAKQMFYDLLRGEMSASKTIERSYVKFVDKDESTRNGPALRVVADRILTNEVTLPGLTVQARLGAIGAGGNFYAALSENGFTYLDYTSSHIEGEDLIADASAKLGKGRCEYGQLLGDGSQCGLKQLAEAGGTVITEEILTEVLAHGQAALGMLAVQKTLG